jgi:predicted molibdopterin-dependent oxidoreductase YjgC
MFRKRPETGAKTLRIFFEDQPIEAASESSVAAALLCAGIDVLRSSAVSGEARGPHCMIGTCYECMVEIDGAQGHQACLTQVRDGMRVKRQAPAPKVEI